MTKFEYIHFVKVAEKPKTVVYEVRSNRSEEVLGEVKWYGPWRQYCFHPALDKLTVWNAGCLRDLIAFIESLPRKTNRKKG